MTSPIPTQPTAVDILRAARAKIDTPEKWTQGKSACNARGIGVTSLNLSAVKWCSIGAVNVAGGRIAGEPVLRFLRLAIGGGGQSIGVWNDMRGRTHAEVMAAFDRAIILAEQSSS